MYIVRGNPKFPDYQESADPQYVERLASEYERAKAFADDAVERAAHYKELLVAALKDMGEADDKGHIWLSAGDFKIKHERRVSNIFKSDEAVAWAEENDLLDQVCEVVTVLVEDKLMSLAFERPDLAPSIQALYDEKISWAFKLTKNKA